MEGRDLGKLRKEGYFRGTKANVFRYQVIGAVMLMTFTLGGLRL